MPIPLNHTITSKESDINSESSHSTNRSNIREENLVASAAMAQITNLQRNVQDTNNTNIEECVKQPHVRNDTQADSSDDESSSDEMDPPTNEPQSKQERCKRSNRKYKYVKNTPFPIQLHQILSNDAYSDIITWLPNGKSFIVLDKKKFVDVVSKKYFKETKYESFTRKLNRWNFIRISKGPDTGAFKHKLFSRDDVSKTYKIKCQKKTDRKKLKDATKKKDSSSPHEENENEESRNSTTTSVLSNPLSSLEAIKKAQMEQIQRRCLLNYLSLKQQYDIWRSREMYHEQLKAQVLNDTRKTPDTSHDTNTLDFSSLTLSPKPSSYTQQQQQLLNKMPSTPTMLSKNPPVPLLPTMMPPIPENDDLTKEESEPKMQSISRMPTVSSKMAIPESDKLSIVVIPKSKDLKEESEPKLQSIAKMATVSNMALKPEDDKISILVAAANQMPISGKELDDEKSTLPPKKKIKKRLSDDESNDPDRYKDPTVMKRASAA